MELAVVFRLARSFALWLMRQGIRLYFAGIRHPQTQGKVERFHGSLERALESPRRARLTTISRGLTPIVREHNHMRPHEALDMQTPASRWQPSPRRYNPYQPPWEYPEGAWTLKVDNHGTIDINGSALIASPNRSSANECASCRSKTATWSSTAPP